MICDTPYYVLPKAGIEKVPVPCGKCPNCKTRRVNDWVFRLSQEMKQCNAAHFITLTYDTSTVPISENGFMTLCKSDFQKFMKRLRILYPQYANIKYYACGEYGSVRGRPHFHAIVFNVPDNHAYFEAWKLDGKQIGNVHVGQVTEKSMAYVMKYIDKDSGKKAQFARDDRQREFSLMSKGLGKNYLTDDIKRYHQQDLSRMYVLKPGGFKQSMPRYYRQKIYDKADLREQVGIIQDVVEKKSIELERQFKEIYGDNHQIDFDTWLTSLKYGRYKSFHSNQKIREYEKNR